MFAALLYVLAGLLAVQAGPLKKRAPILPTADPFYVAPANLSAAKPGDVLRTRQIQPALANQFPLLGAVTAYQLGYRTSNVQGTPAYTVTTVFIPAKPQANLLVSYSVAEDSSYLNCAPSYNFQLGSQQTNSNDGEETVTLLLEGYVVTSADYEGPNSTFSSGRTTGYGTLDALRATLNFNGTGIDKSRAKIIVTGYSGGAISTGWASVLQPTYAPDLSSSLVGFAFGGVPANLTAVVQGIDGGLFAGFAFAGVAGLLLDYPTLQARFNQIKTPAADQAIAYARSHCSGDDLSQFRGMSLETTMYQSDGAALFSDPAVKSVLSSLTLGANKAEVPRVPSFVYQCATDEVIPANQTTTMVNSFCANGAPSLIYQRDTSGACEHLTEAIKGFPAVLTFIADRFAGKPAQVGCKSTDVALPLPDLTALGAVGIPIVQSLLTLAASGKVF